MLRHFDHLTIAVRDLPKAKAFFVALGFSEAQAVVIEGEPFASYMGVPGIKADHVTLVLDGASPADRDPAPALLAPGSPARPAYPRPEQTRHEPHLLRRG